MKRNKGFLLFLGVFILTLALPITVFANKQIYKARLTTGAELHEVVGSNARGSTIITMGPDGVYFNMYIRNLSGQPWGAHIHGPATETENGPVLVSLCGAPGPAALPACTLEANGDLNLTAELSSSLLAQWGLRPVDFQDWAQNGMMYVNVHTDLNPSGEVRGQIYPR